MNRRIGINFHGIGSPGRVLEPGEAPYWISRERFTAILERIVATSRQDDYVITFDDGNASDHDIALPALADRGLTAMFMVLSGRIGKAGSLGPAEIRDMQSAGMVIGSHGIAHRAWTTLGAEELRRELVVSKRDLEDICGRPVTSAGIPFGSYNAKVLRAVRLAGYTAAYSSDGGRMNPRAFLRPRTSVREDMDDRDIADILTGNAPLWRRLRRGAGMFKRKTLPL